MVFPLILVYDSWGEDEHLTIRCHPGRRPSLTNDSSIMELRGLKLSNKAICTIYTPMNPNTVLLTPTHIWLIIYNFQISFIALEKKKKTTSAGQQHLLVPSSIPGVHLTGILRWTRILLKENTVKHWSHDYQHLTLLIYTYQLALYIYI